MTDATGAVLFNQEVPQIFTDAGSASAPRTTSLSPTSPSPSAPRAVHGRGQLRRRLARRREELRVVSARGGDTLAPPPTHRRRRPDGNGYRIEFAGGRDIPAITSTTCPAPLRRRLRGPPDAHRRHGNPYLFVTGSISPPMALPRAPPSPPERLHLHLRRPRRSLRLSVKRDPGGRSSGSPSAWRSSGSPSRSTSPAAGSG